MSLHSIMTWRVLKSYTLYIISSCFMRMKFHLSSFVLWFLLSTNVFIIYIKYHVIFFWHSYINIRHMQDERIVLQTMTTWMRIDLGISIYFFFSNRLPSDRHFFIECLFWNYFLLAKWSMCNTYVSNPLFPPLVNTQSER